MLHINGLRHRFAGSIDVLDIAEMQVGDGEFVSVVGPSGCGKSTLLRIMAGLIVPDEGSVEFDGVPLTGRPGHAGFMPQHDRLLPWRRAVDNAVLAADVSGIDAATSRRRARAMFERFGLVGFEDAWPSQLSGGMRQRLALLRTFLVDRDLLLLDEPFGALDAITRRHMHLWLAEVLAADSRTVVFVTHDVEEALILSDRVLALSPRPGRVVAEVDPAEPRPRSSTIVASPEFIARKVELLAALEAHT